MPHGVSGLRAPGLAYAANAGKLVLFGGKNWAGASGETWILDEDRSRWRPAQTAEHPPPRFWPAMAYGPLAGKIVMHGGSNGTQSFNDTWVFDPIGETWTKAATSEPPPSTSYWHDPAMTYEPASRRMLMIGPISSASTSARVWEYDPQEGEWSPGPPLPSAGFPYGASLASLGDGRVLAFGDGTWSGRGGDAWILNTANGSWTSAVRQHQPHGRPWPSLFYDKARGGVILHGGWPWCGGPMKDSWLYDPVQGEWTELESMPKTWGSESGLAAADTGGGRAFWFSEVEGTTLLFDTVADRWDLVALPEFPAPRNSPALAADPAAGQMVMLGGLSSSETWIYDVALDQWRTSHSKERPPEVWRAGLAPAGNGRFMMYGGEAASNWIVSRWNDTWIYDLASDSWTKALAGPDGPDLLLPVMAHVPPQAGVLLIGKRTWSPESTETWWFDPGLLEWRNLTTGPQPNITALEQLVYDPATETATLFSVRGDDLDIAVWRFDPATQRWTPFSRPGPAPAVGTQFAVSYDPCREVFVLFGGAQGYARASAETWLFNGRNGTWSLEDEESGPGGRAYHRMALDGKSGHILMFGGSAQGARYLERAPPQVWRYGAGGCGMPVPFRLRSSFPPNAGLVVSTLGVILVAAIVAVVLRLAMPSTGAGRRTQRRPRSASKPGVRQKADSPSSPSKK
jgi:hypothetical protein